MAIVVDASAIGAIAWDEPEREELAAYLEGETLIAPRLLAFELVNIAIKKVRRKPDDKHAIMASLILAARVPVSHVDVPAGEVFDLAMRTGLTAYDASYLWLARSRDAELVTLDRALLKYVAEDSREVV